MPNIIKDSLEPANPYFFNLSISLIPPLFVIVGARALVRLVENWESTPLTWEAIPWAALTTVPKNMFSSIGMELNVNKLVIDVKKLYPA